MAHDGKVVATVGSMTPDTSDDKHAEAAASSGKASNLTLGIYEHAVADLRQTICCKVCMLLMYEPFTVACGHAFCYTCLKQWFQDHSENKTCPECRAVITKQPVPCYIARDMINVFLTRPELLPDGETIEKHKLALENVVKVVAEDKSKSQLFGGAFITRNWPTNFAFYDAADCVYRCPQCHYELEGVWCNNCEREYLADMTTDMLSDDELHRPLVDGIDSTEGSHDVGSSGEEGEYEEEEEADTDLDGFIEADEEEVEEEEEEVETEVEEEEDGGEFGNSPRPGHAFLHWFDAYGIEGPVDPPEWDSDPDAPSPPWDPHRPDWVDPYRPAAFAQSLAQAIAAPNEDSAATSHSRPHVIDSSSSDDSHHSDSYDAANPKPIRSLSNTADEAESSSSSEPVFAPRPTRKRRRVVASESDSDSNDGSDKRPRVSSSVEESNSEQQGKPEPAGGPSDKRAKSSYPDKPASSSRDNEDSFDHADSDDSDDEGKADPENVLLHGVTINSVWHQPFCPYSLPALARQSASRGSPPPDVLENMIRYAAEQTKNGGGHC